MRWGWNVNTKLMSQTAYLEEEEDVIHVINDIEELKGDYKQMTEL